MDLEKPDIIIDFNRGKIDLFFPEPEPEIKVGDRVVITDDGGYFARHPDRKSINGIEPYHGQDMYEMTGRVMTVLSISEKLKTSDAIEPVIVLTDGGYSYWFSYCDVWKTYIKLKN